ncbi:MAG: patatin-like phospholipase family protein [Bacteroidetes bacterium]|nr:patatin-like phospholipase family protein [Bacteroidota bacterium]
MKKLIAALLFPALCAAQTKYNYKNLVMEGGGVRGLAYAGVFSVLEKKGVLQQIEKVGGSSAGSIAGMLVCVGYSAAEIDSIMLELPIQKFNDGKWGIVGKYNRFKNQYGLYKGEVFEKWLQQLVLSKTGNADLTFAQLHQLHVSDPVKYKDLYCTGTNLSKQQLEIFSYPNTPDMPITLAVHISSNIPLYFEPVQLDNHLQKIKKQDSTTFINYYVDGGMLCNYPINMFDSCTESSNPLLCDKVIFNPQTIGIKLERPQQIDSLRHNSIRIPAYNINNLNEYFTAFMNLLMETINRRYPNLENERGRTIYVSQGNISSRVKKTKQQDKLLLLNNGINAATEFFAKQE